MGAHGPFRFQGSIKNIESGKIDVLEGGTAHNNIDKESERGDGVGIRTRCHTRSSFKVRKAYEDERDTKWN